MRVVQPEPFFDPRLPDRAALTGIGAADVARIRRQLDHYLKLLDGSHVPLKGVFHVAMVLDDALARDLDRSRIEKVLKPKVAGAANLDQLTRRFDLDCFVLFSSVAALIGNVGQANYVAANAFLEGLARRRRAEGLPALAVGFGAISDVGYLARNADVNAALNEPSVRSALDAQGLTPVGGTAAEFRRVVDADMKRWGAIINRIGLKIDQ